MMGASPADLAENLRPPDVREGLQKLNSTEDTIVAVATPHGRSGIGVVRISGSMVSAIAERFLTGQKPLRKQHAAVCQWVDEHGDVVDDVVVVIFERPRSYTGEDVLEVSAHGNPVVLHAIVESVRKFGVRLASPGEFTLRAVTNGKLDLIQAEAVRDFIDAQTAAQARMARQQLGGVVSRRIKPEQEQLIDLIAYLEAGIDFAEDDLDVPNTSASAEKLSGIVRGLEALQETYAYGKVLGSGIRVAIVGKPNVGKSSLFNRLVAEERAIVTEIPGTTRDVVAEVTDLAGIPMRLFDTAGIRDTTDVVERIGVERSLETLSDADLALFVIDGSEPLTDDDRRIGESVSAMPHLVVANKSDLKACEESEIRNLSPFRVSARSGEGLEALRQEMARRVASRPAEGFGEAVLTSARQNDAIMRAIAALRSGEAALRGGTPAEMALLDLYAGLSSLNELTGETTSEDILGRIFSTFCIGK
jgi:tRNA modification GTPase